MMIHATRSLCNYALDRDCTLSLMHDGCCEVRRTRDADDIIDAVKGIDDICTLLIRNAAGEEQGRAYVMADGPCTCSPDETVVDYRGEFIATWWDATFNRVV